MSWIKYLNFVAQTLLDEIAWIYSQFYAALNEMIEVTG